MKVLMIGLDNSIFDLQSEAAVRMKLYGTICDELHILVLKGAGNRVKISENVFAYPCGANSRLSAIFSAMKTGTRILSEGGKWIITAQDPFGTGFIGWRLAKKFKIGLEVQMHGDFYGSNYWKKEKLINRFGHYLGKFVLRRADAVRVVSERIKKSISGFVTGKIYEIPVCANAVKEGDASFLKNRFSGAYPIILAVGNLVPVKNHKLLIEVFAEIKKELPGAKLVIVGEGSERKSLELLTARYSLQADVDLAGYQNNLADFYSSADIFIHPSIYEGWGRAVVEAAQFGLPIIMSDVGLAGEVIINNESGLVVPINDAAALTEAIIKFAEDGKLRERLKRGAKRATAFFLTKEEFLAKIKESWDGL